MKIKTSDISIRSISEHSAAIPTLAHWFHNEWGFLNKDVTLESRSRDLKSRTCLRSLPLTMVAFHENDILGSYSLEINDLPIRPEFSPWLASVFVHPNYRKKGIGSALIRDALVKAKSLDITRLFLFTMNQSSWYATMGFETLEQLHYCHVPITVMHITL